jgi:hypothetical protein
MFSKAPEDRLGCAPSEGTSKKTKTRKITRLAIRQVTKAIQQSINNKPGQENSCSARKREPATSRAIACTGHDVDGDRGQVAMRAGYGCPAVLPRRPSDCGVTTCHPRVCPLLCFCEAFEQCSLYKTQRHFSGRTAACPILTFQRTPRHHDNL